MVDLPYGLDATMMRRARRARERKLPFRGCDVGIVRPTAKGDKIQTWAYIEARSKVAMDMPLTEDELRIFARGVVFRNAQ